jgi:hypothetical protein
VTAQLAASQEGLTSVSKKKKKSQLCVIKFDEERRLKNDGRFKYGV